MSSLISAVPSTAVTAALLERLSDRPSRLRANINLTRELAITSFKLKYAGSVLGYVWSLVKPLMLFGMMYLIFAQFLLKGRTASGENFPVELLIGIVVWTFFADATTTALQAVVTNGDMLRKARFPRWILVAAASLSAVITLTVNLVLVLALGLPLHWYSVGWQTLLLAPLLVELFALSLGIGLLLSALYVYYRDLGHIWEILLQLLFYASAIVFPFSLIPVPYQPLVALIPTAQIVEDMRRAIVSTAIPWSSDVLGLKAAVPVAAAFLTIAIGAVVFDRLSRRFGERL